jgi:predicted ABC-type ATPase
MQSLAPNPELALQAAVTPGPQMGFGEAFRSSFDTSLVTFSGAAESNAFNDVVRDLVRDLNARGEDIDEYLGANLLITGDAYVDDPWTYWRFQENALKPLNEAILRQRAADPNFGYEPLDTETLRRQTRERILTVEAGRADLQARSQTTSGSLGSLAGAAAAMGQDLLQGALGSPGVAATVLMGGGAANFASQSLLREVGKRALFEGLVGAGAEVWMQSGVAAFRKQYGLEYTFEDFALGVGLGFAGGAALGAGMQGFALATRYKPRVVARELGRAVDQTSPEQINARMLQLEAKGIAEGLRALQRSGAPLPPEGMRFLQLYDAGRELMSSPLEGPRSNAEHASNLTAAATILDTGDLPAPLPASSTPRVLDDINHYDNLDDTVYRFQPDEIEVDAQTFQFKAGGDAFGVTERLAGITTWDPIKAGQIVVYEFADGRRVIADGHQRLGLARRIAAQDPQQKPVIYGSLLREADGISPEQARVIAALKNIAEGSGTAIDAAKVLRLAPDRIGELPPRSALVRQAQELAQLSDEAFGMIVNGVVPANYAAIVGRLVDVQEQQLAALSVLARVAPDNVTQAENIVRQVVAEGFDQAEQVDMLGAMNIAESLYLERAKVLDAAMKVLRRDRALFASLIDNQARIEAQGNQLSQAANMSKRELDDQALTIIQAVANRKGEVSDALTQAARRLKEGDAGGATKQFVSAVRDAARRGVLDGVDAGGEGRAVRPAPEADRLAAGPSREALADFDQPDLGIAKQSDQLDVDEFGGGLREAAQPDVALREDLRRVVDAGATPDQIDAHPAIIDALERAAAIPETHLHPNYSTDAWQLGREFVFGQDIVTGYDAAVARLYDNAKRLAWDAEGKAPQPVRQERRATIVLGAPAAGKSAFSNRIAQQRGAALIDADEAKKVLPEYKSGVGANAVHKESTDLAGLMLQRAVSNNDNVLLPRVGHTSGSIETLMTSLKEMGYEVDLVVVVVPSDEAYRRNIRRFIDTGRLVPPAYVRNVVGDNPTSTYNGLKAKANRHAKIDNSGPQSSPKPVSDASADNPLEGIDLRLRDTTSRSGRGVRALGATEQTAQGEQRLVPGVEPVSQAQRLNVEAARPLTGGDAPADFGLFDTGARRQIDLMDLVPAGREVDGVAQFQTRAAALAEIEQDKAMLRRFSECVS